MKMVRVTAIGRKGGVPNNDDKLVLLCGLKADGTLEDGEWMGYHVGEKNFTSPFILKNGRTVYYGREENYTETTNIGEKMLKESGYFALFRPSGEPGERELTFEIWHVSEYQISSSPVAPSLPILKANSPKKKQLPTLIALPITVKSNPRFGKAKRAPRPRAFLACEVEFLDNPAIVPAIDSLRAVIELTLFFLQDGPPASVKPIAEWLDGLKDALEELVDELKSVLEAPIYTRICMEYSQLSHFLYEESSIEDKMELADYELSNLLHFWLKEVRRRADELYAICNESVSCVDAEKSFFSISNMRYPL